MTASRWRGTVIYTGTLATIGTVAITRFGGLTATEQAAGSAPSPVVSSSSAGSASTGSGESAGAPKPTDTSTPATGSTTSSTVTVAGAVSQTRYGPVQVSVTFTDGQIVDVHTLQAPSSQHESAQISARSTPLLAKSVIAAQSAKIDTVSGATYTSEGYRESAQSAIDQVG